jgi:transcriptional repressor NrdR
MVMARLKNLDHIAYLRFASVYREFADITTLKEEIDTLSGTAVYPANQLPLLPPEGLVTMKTQRRGR